LGRGGALEIEDTAFRYRGREKYAERERESARAREEERAICRNRKREEERAKKMDRWMEMEMHQFPYAMCASTRPSPSSIPQ